jgi:autophagy-related protein 9
MLNPMSRQHQGYSQANQSLLEEDENRSSEGEEEDGRDLETGQTRSTIFQSTVTLDKSKSKGKRKVSWDAGASEMNVLRPNIHQEDKIHEPESSDDEVPQSFMIEASRKPAPSRVKAKDESGGGGRRQPLHSVSGRLLPPILPTTAGQELPPSVFIPPRPSEVDPEADDERIPRNASSGAGFNEPLSDYNHRSKSMRGLDEYERALWNWVNVYNLDAFLQEVYYYYEGKGIYSIALSRGLNLLLVILSDNVPKLTYIVNYRTVGFVIGFSTFLLGCIDYSRIRHGKTSQLSHVIVEHCVSR